MKKSLLAKTIFCLLVFASCKNGFSNKEEKPPLENLSDDELVTPYTDMSLLENTRSATVSDPNVVEWKVARFFAVVEKVSFEKHYPSWKGAKVSKKPIVIYDPENNTPMYYEFRVVKDDKELGAITCNATKESGNPVVYVSEMANKVVAKVARELKNENLKLVAVNYPGKFVVGQNSIATRSVGSVGDVEFKDAITAERLDINNVFIPIRTKDVLENLDGAIMKELNISEVDKAEMLAKIKEEDDEAKEFWQAIDVEKILSITDEEIESSLHYCEHDMHTKHVYATEKLWEDEKILSDWADKAKWKVKAGEPNYCHVHELNININFSGKKSGQHMNIKIGTK